MSDIIKINEYLGFKKEERGNYEPFVFKEERINPITKKPILAGWVSSGHYFPNLLKMLEWLKQREANLIEADTIDGYMEQLSNIYSGRMLINETEEKGSGDAV